MDPLTPACKWRKTDLAKLLEQVESFKLKRSNLEPLKGHDAVQTRNLQTRNNNNSFGVATAFQSIRLIELSAAEGHLISVALWQFKSEFQIDFNWSNYELVSSCRTGALEGEKVCKQFDELVRKKLENFHPALPLTETYVFYIEAIRSLTSVIFLVCR